MKWSNIGTVGAVISVVLLTSCANIGVTTIKPSAPQPETCILDIYTNENEVKRPFEVLCLIDSRTGTTAFHTKTGAAAIEQAKPEACKCGAEAIIVTGIDTEGITLATWGKGKAIIKAIRYTDH